MCAGACSRGSCCSRPGVAEGGSRPDSGGAGPLSAGGGGAWLAQCGPTHGWRPLPPVRTGDTAAGPPPRPHDAGHLLQQQTVIPVDDGQPALLQLRRHTGHARAVPGPPRSQPCPGGLQPRPWASGPPRTCPHCCGRSLGSRRAPES